MTLSVAKTPSLLSAVLPSSGVAAKVGAVVLGSLLLAASAKVQVPFWPVPMTMQTFVVLVLGMAYGSRLAVASVLTYLAQGLAGLPVFAGAIAGPAYMMGPTAGYLVGFVAAAAMIGLLAERGWDRSPLKAFVAMSAGHALIFVFGVAWLSSLMGLEKAIAVGVTPFLAATVLKSALGMAVMVAAWSALRRRQA
ncbi:biotin transporter BioY [Novispirillum itersonii]|uniref:biotin transporter BioY n=1 Tax=Novispirillum itersonii TaxID=189 RepID=UPI00036FB48F|nr:biotin transporter BioY [Novispirillum itersonii]